ncbi:MAG: hypothetical protein O9301_03550 [Leptospira sp.]|nr:hypothetical protein [Leptospira sp.]
MKSIELNSQLASKSNSKTDDNELSLFNNPDIYLKNKPVTHSFALRVLSQILPYKFLVYSLSLSLLLFCIPIGTLIWGKSEYVVHSAFLPILISSSLFFCFYCLILGFLLLNTRIPFLTEWKEKLGFEEV